jgi:hypothetical protein
VAAPAWLRASAGAVITTTSGNSGSLASVTVGNVILLQILRDGDTSGASVVDTNSTIENLAGTDDTMTEITQVNGEPVGNPQAARQQLWLGRALATSVNADIGNAGGDDLYIVLHEFSNVNTGTTIASVFENVTAGVLANGAGTSTTVADTGVTTLGVDRLALNCVGINDDATGIASFTGETGGDWTMVKSFESSTGTDGTASLMTAAMAAAGTINGGTATITSDGWGVVGFALIGTTVATTSVPHEPIRALQAVNRGSVW